MEKIELNFNNDVIIGKGKLTFNNGNILIGNFNNNDYNPIDGIINFPNGDIYEGEFKENFKLKGKMKYNTGEIYDGELELQARLDADDINKNKFFRSQNFSKRIYSWRYKR